MVWGFFGIPDNDVAPDDLVVDAVAGTITTAWDLGEGNNTTLADQLASLLAGGLYLNIHAQQFPAGAIRGQIVPEPGSAALLSLGCAVLGGARWRARSAKRT